MGNKERNSFKIASFISFGFCLYGAFKQNGYLTWSAGIGAAVFLILAFLDKFKEINAFGFKAKLAEASEVINRGQDVLNELRLLSKYVGEVTLYLVQAVGRSGWYTLRKQ